ncbi:tail tubular protein B [Aeromonas phage PZL-Ah152]|uniref:Tail tubular protein B n=1 Tax=Aeromonas phage PZL-Ah152 TaxID=2820393 RepID=A0A8A6C5Z2_9CAUD|nr:tail tubular protein B [Aeromonas phage PZL-Ah152]
MALVSQSIKNLKGGISQQPDILRFPDQGAQQINAFSSEVEGLQKRPPSVNIKRLDNKGAFGVKPLCHVINRDEVERYSVFFTGSAIRIFDLHTGAEIPVDAPNGLSYVTTPDPRNAIRCVTVADYTFVVNRNVVTDTADTTTPVYHEIGKNALVILKGGQYAKTFKIFINGGEVATFTTPLGDQVEQASQIDIQFILGKLAEGITTNLGGAGWTVQVLDGYLWIKAPANDSIRSLRVQDGYNGQLLIGIINDTQKTLDLPVKAPANYQIRISGDAASGQDDYWVRFDESRMVWTEIAEPGLLSNLEKTTMPFVLIREASGRFTFKPTEWAPRACGDDDTNPWPSFVGETLNDVFFYRNRLGFLSGENIILSEAGSYFNFFPRSVAVSSDADPIDVAVSTNRINILKYAVPFSEELLIWSDGAQFVLNADGILTPTSVRLDMTTEFEVTDKARPYGIGRGVYFVSPRAKFSSIRRYYAVQDVTQVKNAEDISAHVPSYIPNGVFKIHGSSTENFLTVLTEGAPSKVYMYKFLYLEEQVAQQSWSHWDFGDGVTVFCCELIGAVMHLILDAPSGIFMERIEFTQNTTDYPTEPYRLYMDRKVQYTIPSGAYNNDDYKTYVRLADLYSVIPVTGDYFAVTEQGVVFEFPCPTGGWATNGGVLDFDGNLEGFTLFIGEKYTMLYEFSKFLIKSTDTAGGTTTEDIGRLQLRRAWVNYNKSGNFRIEVDNQGRTARYHMTGKRSGTKDLILGEENLDTGQMRYPVAGNAKNTTVTLVSDTPSPVAIIGGGWEGNYVRRSSGI